MAKRAYKKLARRVDGTTGVVHIDVDTGKEVTDLSGYTIITAGGFDDADLFKRKEKDKKKEEEKDPFLEEFSGPSGFEPELSQSLGNMRRDPTNNFGFIPKSAAVKAIGFLGLPGKVISSAINMNNIAAKNAARESMGLPPVSLAEAAKNTVFGVDDKIADVEIGGKTYTVSIGGGVKDGKTTLTPGEARSRAATQGGLAEVGKAKSTGESVSKGFPDAPQVGPRADSPAGGAMAARNMDIPDGQVTRTPLAGIESLHPAMQERASAFMEDAKKEGLDLTIASAHRSKEEQQSLYNQGRTTPGSKVTNAKPGDSFHNYGLSFDIVPTDLKGTKNWSPEDARWGKIGELAQKHGFTWGGNFKSIKDMPHIQAPITLSDAKNAPLDARGYPQLSPQSELAVRGNFVATPTLPNRETAVAQAQPTEVATVEGMKSITAGGRPSSPAQAAALGYISRSEAERAAIATTLAGELSPSQLSGIARGDPIALTELANMVTTIENRAGALGGLDKALNPDAYNSLMSGNFGVTKANMSAYEKSIQSLVDSYYTPNGIKPSDYNYTHYYAPKTLEALGKPTPAWDKDMKNAYVVGDHKFGTIESDFRNPYNDYSLGRSIAHERSSYNLSFDGGYSPNESGAFSSARGSDGRGAGMETGFSPEQSFGGFNAGSLGGSASGLGSGLGAAGSDASIGGGFSPSAGGLGNYSGGTSSSNAGGFNSDTYGGSSPSGSGTSPSGFGGALSGI